MSQCGKIQFKIDVQTVGSTVKVINLSDNQDN